MKAEKKTLLTIEELRKRINEICSANGWTSGCDFVFENLDADFMVSSINVFTGFVLAMLSSGIITSKESDLFTDSMFKNCLKGFEKSAGQEQ